MESPKTPLKYYQQICPNCGKIAEADFVDIGVGMQQSGPFHCDECEWLESSPRYDWEMDLDD